MATTLNIGDNASITRSFTEQDVIDYAELSGDKNPAHLDAAYAAETQFKHRIVHGMLVGSLFSALLGGVYSQHYLVGTCLEKAPSIWGRIFNLKHRCILILK